MHESSLKKMELFCDRYLKDFHTVPLRILDIGSQDVNGSYRPLFERDRWDYVGADLAPGKNVDVILEQPYSWKQFRTASFDVVVSGQAFEHIEYVWLTLEEIERVLKPGGLCCVIAPAGGYEHRYPLDCWRFYPDGMQALIRHAGLERVEVYTEWEGDPYPDQSEVWQDTVLVAKKRHRTLLARAVKDLRRRALRILSVRSF